VVCAFFFICLAFHNFFSWDDGSLFFLFLILLLRMFDRLALRDSNDLLLAIWACYAMRETDLFSIPRSVCGQVMMLLTSVEIQLVDGWMKSQWTPAPSHNARSPSRASPLHLTLKLSFHMLFLGTSPEFFTYTHESIAIKQSKSQKVKSKKKKKKDPQNTPSSHQKKK
jgi:hypothetical protein